MKIKLIIKTFIIALCLCAYISGQQFSVKGKVVSSENNRPLVFATVRIINGTTGTTTNSEGKFELQLKAGKYLLTASYMGFVSDTLSIEVNGNLQDMNFHLKPSTINLSEVIILPKENPANEIIRRAIKRKEERNKKIQSYKFDAYTKGVLETNMDLSGASSGSLSLSIGINDTTPVRIAAIIENQSVGYFKQPDKYWEKIIARKQTSNLPPSVNTLTGGRLIQNFYSDDVMFFERPLKSPLSKDALDYYYFFIADTVSIDNQNVFRLVMTPNDNSDPGFIGSVYISAKSYDMLKVEFTLNRAANTGGIFDNINILQQFYPFGDSLFMPVDYHLYVHSNVLGLAKLAFEVNTSLYNYEMNIPLDDAMFTKAVITVNTDADKKDSAYWLASQKIPNSKEEIIAYKSIDSIQSIPLTFWDKFSIFSNRMSITDNFSVSAPLAVYHFNRVEGHSIDFGLFGENYFDSRLNSSLNMSYGFSDKKFKYDFDAKYLTGDYRTTAFKLNIFNKTKILFAEEVNYSEIFNTLMALISKYDINDYYYSTGVDFGFETEATSVLKLKAAFYHVEDASAAKNTDYSFFARSKTFRENPPVNNVKLNYAKFGFGLDFRDYIEDGMFRRRIGIGNSYVLIDGDVSLSKNKILNSSMDFALYELRLNGKLKTFGKAEFNFKVNGFYNAGTLPYQMLYSLPGNIDLSSRNYSFRTLNVNQILGDRVVAAFFEHNFSDELFRMSGIPILKSLELQLNYFFDIGYADIGSRSRSVLVNPVNIFPHPFYETGFGIGHVLFPIWLEFAWKLNYRGQNNFRVGLSTFIID